MQCLDLFGGSVCSAQKKVYLNSSTMHTEKQYICTRSASSRRLYQKQHRYTMF
uniref:Uncharacterized protein n=2 Tax=Anguilla anguilla TaxID=7936 RepID=A0A0E9Q9W7_ANGAN